MKILNKITPLYRKYGEDSRTCNICRKQYKSLSYDHVPPHCVQKIMNVSIDSNALAREGPVRGALSRNGVKFQTICTSCNNKLGYEYDNRLGEFIKNAQEIYEQNSYKKDMHSSSWQIDANPSDLIRSLCGHLLAAKVDIDDATMDNQIRDFLFDTSRSIPDEINIFYWSYPYYEVRVMRDFAIVSQQGYYGSIIKFYPLAFFFTDSKEFMGLPNLRSCITTSNGDTRFEKINISLSHHEKHWPEGGFEEGLSMPILTGQTSSKCIIGRYKP